MSDYQSELAWAAGFFDGEGSVCVRIDKRVGRTPGLQFHLEQVDVRPLLRFARAIAWKGRITQRPPRGNSKAIHRLTMGHRATLATIELLWPYLSEPKREQFLKAVGKMESAA